MSSTEQDLSNVAWPALCDRMAEATFGGEGDSLRYFAEEVRDRWHRQDARGRQYMAQDLRDAVGDRLAARILPHGDDE